MADVTRQNNVEINKKKSTCNNIVRLYRSDATHGPMITEPV